MHYLATRRIALKALATSTLGSIILLSGQARAQTSADKTLPADTSFFVPRPVNGAAQQAIDLLRESRLKDALLIVAMEATPQAVWLTGDTPAQTAATVTNTLGEARLQHSTPVFVLYNIPGRDCGSYSAGGAENTADYELWVDAIAAALGDQKAVIMLEPDAIANLPSDCGYDPTQVNIPEAVANRYAQINYAITRLEQQSQTSVYIDAGNSHWQAVPVITQRLITAGVQQAQGFFSNVSNFNLSSYESKFDTWVSDCMAFGMNAADGGWRLGNYSYCASQYYSPLGTVNPDDISTWIYTDEWYQQNMGNAVPVTHFVIDTSRNGDGPFYAARYADPPYNQPAPVITTLNNGSWCNPPARGLGVRPTARTGIALLDAYLWVKTPGQSDGTCDSAGGARAWDYDAYDPEGWPTTAAQQAIFDPLWGLYDPPAGAWFPQQALDLARRANPPLEPAYFRSAAGR